MIADKPEGWCIAAPLSNAPTEAYAVLLEALIEIADFDMRAGCGCSHPCRCDTDYSRAIAFDTLRDIARDALAKVAQ